MENTNTGLSLVKNHVAEFEQLLKITHGNADMKAVVMNELEYLNIHAMRLTDLHKCEAVTVVQCIKTVLKWNLSLDPDAGLVYVTTRNMNFGTKDKPEYRPVMEVKKTANGTISVNRQLGNILDIKRPNVKKDATGKVTEVVLEYLVPSTPNPRWETVEFDESDFGRWRAASHRQNGRFEKDKTKDCSNPLYVSFKGGIDPEFARAKAIQHGLKKLGTNHNATKPILGKFDPLVDVAIANEEVEEEFVQHEDLSSTVHVTTHEEKNFNDIPNSNEL